MWLSAPWMNTGACQVNKRASTGRAATLAAWCYWEGQTTEVQRSLLRTDGAGCGSRLGHPGARSPGSAYSSDPSVWHSHSSNSLWCQRTWPGQGMKGFRSQLNKRGHLQQWDGPKPPCSHLMVPCCQVLRNSRAATLWTAVEGFRYWGTPQ